MDSHHNALLYSPCITSTSRHKVLLESKVITMHSCHNELLESRAMIMDLLQNVPKFVGAPIIYDHIQFHVCSCYRSFIIAVT